MKRCPECRRDYYDDSLLYCLDDGTLLLEGPSTAPPRDEPQTAILPDPVLPSEAATKTQPVDESQRREASATKVTSGTTGEVRRWAKPLAIVIAALAIAGIAFGLYRYYGARSQTKSTLPLKVTPLTSSPQIERDVAFSPDGKQIAYVWTGENDNNFDIYVKLIGAGEPLRLTTDAAREMSPTWSPDGRYIAFVRGTTERRGVYIVPALGGAERKLTDVAEWKQNGTRPQSLNWSPDGKTLVLIDKTSEDDPWAVFLVSADTGERTQLTRPPAGDTDGYLSISPDGTRVAFARSQSVVGYVYTVPISGGEPTRVTSEEAPILGLAWTADGTELLYACDRGAATPTMWRVPAAGGPATVVAGVGDGVHEISVDRRGGRVAYAQASSDVNIYRFPLSSGPHGRTAPDAPASFISSTRIENNPRYSPDGRRIAFGSDRSGGNEIWVCDADGKNAVQLTNFNTVHFMGANWSPDSRWLAFSASANGNEDVYMIGADGGTPRRLTEDPAPDITPSWSHDGRWIYFTSKRTGRSEVWKMPSAGGDAIQLTHTGGSTPQESPDGRSVYYIKGNPRTRLRSEPGIWEVSSDGGEEIRIVDLRVEGGDWTLSPQGIYLLAFEPGQTPYSFDFFDFRTRKISQIKILDGPRATFQIAGMTVSPDEKWVVFAQRDKLDFDLMLVDNFR